MKASAKLKPVLLVIDFQIVRVLAAIILSAVLSLKADTQPRGPDRLREIIVFPEMNVTFSYGISTRGNETVITKNIDLADEISRIRNELKQQPDDVKQLFQLGYVLDSDGQTNESKKCYQKIELLCRNKAEASPQDGLNLTDLGQVLVELGQRDEAAIVYRKATSVSTNEWRCWVRRGNFLANQYFDLLFPEILRSQIVAGQKPSQSVLDYRPSADTLTKSEASCSEASQCFERAVALAPKESEVFFQRAGYLSVSNWQNCFFRSFRNNEKIDSATWVMAFFTKDAIANLKKAAALNPKNYEYICLAAYFEWLNSTTRANDGLKFSPLTDEARQSIHEAMNRLENLSQGPDKKLAAGALENLGTLNIFFGNYEVAKANLHQALSFDPTREQAWDMLLGALTKLGSPEERMATCEARLKQKDSTRNHLLLARAFQYQKKWDKAGEQAEAALKHETNNIVAHLELLGLALKQSTDTNFMAKAFEEVARTEAVYVKLPDNPEKQKRWREYTLNVAILYGLENAPAYQKAANAWVDAVLKYFPGDQQAVEILKALN